MFNMFHWSCLDAMLVTFIVVTIQWSFLGYGKQGDIELGFG